MRQPGGDHNKGQVPRQGLQRNGGDRLLTNGAALALGDNSGKELPADRICILDIRCISPFCRQLGHDNAADQPQKHAVGSRCDTQSSKIRESILIQHLAGRNGWAGTAKEGDGDQPPKCRMQVTAGMQTGEKEYGKDHGNGKLYSPVDLAIDTVTGNILGPFFPFALFDPQSLEANGGKKDCDQCTGIVPAQTGQGNDLQAIRSNYPGNKTSDQADRDKEVLEYFNMLANDLCHEENNGYPKEVHNY